MPAIIHYTYFNSGELFIPNSQVIPDIQDNQPTAIAELTSFIEKYEKLLLVGALGIEQYNILKANQEQTSGIWYDLINGKEFDNKVWTGLKTLIPPFIFCKYLENGKSYYTGVGMERSNAKNSTSVNPTEKIVEVWNTFIETYGGNDKCDYRNIYPIFYYTGWNLDYYNNHTYVSLLDYLKAFPDDYSTEYFNRYEFKNRFGI